MPFTILPAIFGIPAARVFAQAAGRPGPLRPTGAKPAGAGVRCAGPGPHRDVIDTARTRGRPPGPIHLPTGLTRSSTGRYFILHHIKVA